VAKAGTGTRGTVGAIAPLLSVKTKCITPVFCPASDTDACGYEKFVRHFSSTTGAVEPDYYPIAYAGNGYCCKPGELCASTAMPSYPAGVSGGIGTYSYSCVVDVVCNTGAGETACGRRFDHTGPTTKCCAANEFCDNGYKQNYSPVLPNDSCFRKPCAQQAADICPGQKCVDYLINDYKPVTTSGCAAI
jgi:hypothetical protein